MEMYNKHSEWRCGCLVSKYDSMFLCTNFLPWDPGARNNFRKALGCKGCLPTGDSLDMLAPVIFTVHHKWSYWSYPWIIGGIKSIVDNNNFTNMMIWFNEYDPGWFWDIFCSPQGQEKSLVQWGPTYKHFQWGVNSAQLCFHGPIAIGQCTHHTQCSCEFPFWLVCSKLFTNQTFHLYRSRIWVHLKLGFIQQFHLSQDFLWRAEYLQLPVQSATGQTAVRGQDTRTRKNPELGMNSYTIIPLLCKRMQI